MAADKKLFTFYQGSNYLALPRDPQPWLIEQLVAQGNNNLFGKPKLGKSYLTLGMAIAISDPAVETFLDHRVAKHGPVLYLQVDTPRVEWAHRTEKLKNAGYNIEGIYFTDTNLVPFPLNITAQTVMEGLKEAIKECTPAPVLLVVDTLREVHEGDEDKSKDMKLVISALVGATMETNTSLLLVSHERKGGFDNDKDDDDLMDAQRGSSYVAGKMDVVMKLTEKRLTLKGRAVGLTKLSITRDELYMVQLDGDKKLSEANLKFVVSNAQLDSIAEKARMLAAMEKIEEGAARKRIDYFMKKNGAKNDN